jgi:hypothetical protein
MDVKIKLTVFFEDPFYVGVFERIENDILEVAKITFGSEPKDMDVYEFILKKYNTLKFYKSSEIESKSLKKANPKRLQRQVQKEMKETGIGTKAQEAIKLQTQTINKEKRKIQKEEKIDLENIKFQKKLEKKKQKHKGH